MGNGRSQCAQQPALPVVGYQSSLSPDALLTASTEAVVEIDLRQSLFHQPSQATRMIRPVNMMTLSAGNSPL
jgi:hypothetical protein